jgi:hypothetical protein
MILKNYAGAQTSGFHASSGILLILHIKSFAGNFAHIFLMSGLSQNLISHAKNRITVSNAFHSYPGVQASFSRVLQSNSQLFC